MSSKLFLVENCCFYMPLASGTKFFGFLSLSGSVLLLFFGCIDLLHLVYWGQQQQHDNTVWYIEIGLNLTMQTIQSATATLLLLGVYQRKPEMIVYWLFTTPFIALLEFTILRNVTLHFFLIQYYEVEWFILNSITLFDDIYGWVVAYSYYHTIKAPDAAVV